MNIYVGEEFNPNYIRVRRGDVVTFIIKLDESTVTEGRPGEIPLFDTNSMSKGSKFFMKVIDDFPQSINVYNKEYRTNATIDIIDPPYNLKRVLIDRLETNNNELYIDEYNKYLYNFKIPESKRLIYEVDNDKFYSNI